VVVLRHHMARRSDRDDPTAQVRRLLRDLKDAARLANSATAARLCPGVPVAARQAALCGTIEIALFRISARPREILRRYDLNGESAGAVQRALALSPRQFFRDRRAGLAALTTYLFGQSRDSGEAALPCDPPAHHVAMAPDATIAGRAFARSLWQSGSIECLAVLRDLAQQAGEPIAQADLLLDFAEAAADYEEHEIAGDGMRAAARIVDAIEDRVQEAAYLRGRLARAQAHLAGVPADAAARYAHAASLLRRSVLDDAGSIDARSALADTLGDVASLHFSLGKFAEARAASLEARDLIEAFDLSARPRALEILAMNAALDACFSGGTKRAVDLVASLLVRAIDSGWCSTASRLGAYIVGLNGVRGDYEEAIRWYTRMSSLSREGARPSDRSNLMMEAAHAYTMTGRPAKALSLLASVKPGEGCPRAEVPDWHAFASAALERLDQDIAALREARQALAGYAAQRAARGTGDAHRLAAICYAKLGKPRPAREHIAEAERLTESFGTPYGLLRTLVAKANILENDAMKMEAIDFARLLRALG
jgi:tetratricopeptide (TPR) repeat protein